jgi:phosphoribosylaminoimidazolecarboxamide formyltransferase / IMP cyclohydrolase
MDAGDKKEIDIIPIRRALISVTDKTGLARLGRRLNALGIEIISTGGTAKELRTEKSLKKKIIDISFITDLPEMMDGRLKTLHHRVHGGLLAIRSNKNHMEAMAKHGMCEIDLLIVNLYKFESAAVMANMPYAEAVEQIDIGGPAMIQLRRIMNLLPL